MVTLLLIISKVALSSPVRYSTRNPHLSLVFSSTSESRISTALSATIRLVVFNTLWSVMLHFWAPICPSQVSSLSEILKLPYIFSILMLPFPKFSFALFRIFIFDPEMAENGLFSSPSSSISYFIVTLSIIRDWLLEARVSEWLFSTVREPPPVITRSSTEVI